VKRLAFAALLFAVGCAHSDKQPKPPADEEKVDTEDRAQTPPPSNAATTASGATVAPQPGQPAAPAPPKPLPAKIKITIRSNPPKATVFWGKKNLGITPVILERPRDSGPVDLIVRNEGFFPVHTRAYTFRNDGYTVKMTKLEDRMTLFGAKQPVEPLPGTPGAPGSESDPNAPPGAAPLPPPPSGLPAAPPQ
jgi:hypothetical protein